MSEPAPANSYVRRQYRRPPIADAICELKLRTEQDWNPALPGLLYERLRETYPGTPRQQAHSAVEIQAQEPGTVVVRQSVPGVEFPDREERGLVTVAPGLLVVRIRQTYPGWERFAERIRDAAE